MIFFHEFEVNFYQTLQNNNNNNYPLQNVLCYCVYKNESDVWEID